MLNRIPAIALACLCVCVPAWAQSGVDMQRILDRLDQLEKQNQELRAEIQELRSELNPAPATTTAATTTPPPSLAERADVQESRTAELAQSKVGTTQRMPVSLTGMVLFNAFHNGANGGTQEVPITAQLNPTTGSNGATFRQTVIGLRFNGPDLPGGGKASGSAYFDFWGGTSAPSNNLFRVRLATIDLTWKDTTVTVGQDKPIVAPGEPMSLAQVGLSPLTGAGNLWNWQPQARVEQRFHFTDQSGLTAQAGVYETAEVYPTTAPTAFAGSLQTLRPAFESRLVLYHSARNQGVETKHFEIAPGVHVSNTHVAGQTVNSRLGTLDWLIKPANLIAFSGAFFTGTDAAGLGGLRQGFTFLPTGAVIPVHATGGWSQLALFPADRLSFHIYGGEEQDRASDLVANSIHSNFVYAGNAIFKLAPNVLAALEISQTRTSYTTSGIRINNHYDLALAYLF